LKAADEGQIYKIPAEDHVLTIPFDGVQHKVDSILLSIYEIYIEKNWILNRSIHFAYNTNQVIYNLSHYKCPLNLPVRCVHVSNLFHMQTVTITVTNDKSNVTAGTHSLLASMNELKIFFRKAGDSIVV